MLKKYIAAAVFSLLATGVAHAGSTSYSWELSNVEIPDAGRWADSVEWQQHGVRLRLEGGLFKEIQKELGGIPRQGVLLAPGALYVYLDDLEALRNNPIHVEVDVVGGMHAVLSYQNGYSELTESSANTGTLETLHLDLAQSGAQYLHVYSDLARTDWVDAIRVEVVPVPAALWLLGGGLAGVAGLRRKLSS